MRFIKLSNRHDVVYSSGLANNINSKPTEMQILAPYILKKDSNVNCHKTLCSPEVQRPVRMVGLITYVGNITN